MTKSKEPVANVVKRVKRQKEKRKAAGWCEVRVWVPCKEDAEVIKQLAAKMRKFDSKSTEP